jgi:hypothetical protein
MKTYLFLFVFALLAYSCIGTLPDEELTIKRTSYYGNEIRLDGYYFEFLPSYNTYSNLIFYRNGVMMSFDYTSKIKDFYNNNKYVESVKKDKDSWGIYIVRNDSIIVQEWYLNPNNIVQFKVSNYKLKILNDTTLFIGTQNGDSAIYHFKQFSPKPDSTNVFIK